MLNPRLCKPLSVEMATVRSGPPPGLVGKPGYDLSLGGGLMSTQRIYGRSGSLGD